MLYNLVRVGLVQGWLAGWRLLGVMWHSMTWCGIVLCGRSCSVKERGGWCNAAIRKYTWCGGGGWVGGAMQLCVHLAARRCFIEHHTQTHFQMSSIGNISEENDLFRILQIIVRVMLKHVSFSCWNNLKQILLVSLGSYWFLVGFNL